MLIGICQIDLYLPNSHSLKDKRNLIKSITLRIRHNYNVSISEIDNFELWKNSTLGVACIGNEKKHLNKVINEIILFLEKQNSVQLMKFEINLI